MNQQLGNKEEFERVFNEIIIPEIPGADKLLNYIEQTDFFVAPASSKNHLAKEGGLVEHSLNVLTCLYRLLDTFNLDFDMLGVSEAEVCLVALCHDLCKANMYKLAYRNVKKYSNDGLKSDEGGRYDWFTEPYYTIEEELVLGHGEKSLFLVQNFIPNVSLDVAQAIRWHMGAFNHPGTTFADPLTGNAFAQCKLAFFTHLADMIATWHIELNK